MNDTKKMIASLKRKLKNAEKKGNYELADELRMELTCLTLEYLEEQGKI